MLQTINCQLIFALIYCAYVAGNILYYIYIYTFTCIPILPFLGILSMSNVATDEKICLDSGCCRCLLLLLLIKQIIKIEFCFFLCRVFYAFCSAFIDSRASNGAACFHFNYGTRLGRLKCEYIHQTLCWVWCRGVWRKGEGCVYTCNARSNIIVIKNCLH